jgi:hypothetical protein
MVGRVTERRAEFISKNLCSKSFDLTDLKRRNSFGRQPILTDLGPKVLDLSLVSKMVFGVTMALSSFSLSIFPSICLFASLG